MIVPWDPDLYNRALRFAGEAHGEQRVPGTAISYLMHLCQVTQEALGAVLADPSLNGDLVMACALLHDTVEDTDTARTDVAAAFGEAVAAGVDALSKRARGPSGQAWSKAEKMADSLARIRAQPREVWVVKLADRITNLQAPPGSPSAPPSRLPSAGQTGAWSIEKITAYHREAEQILAALGDASPHLSTRMHTKLQAYTVHWARLAGPAPRIPAAGWEALEGELSADRGAR